MRPIIAVPDDHTAITPGMPALGDVVTNHACLMKQRRAVTDLNFVSSISARGYEGTGAGEECQCQFSHVRLLNAALKKTSHSRHRSNKNIERPPERNPKREMFPSIVCDPRDPKNQPAAC